MNHIPFEKLAQSVFEQMPRRAFTIVESGRRRVLWGHQDFERRCVNCMHDHQKREQSGDFVLVDLPYYLCKAHQTEPCRVCECTDEVVPIPEDQIDPK